MSVKIVIKPNTYFDSVSLMSISTRANKLDGVEQAFVAMATEMNKGVLKNLGLLTPELEQAIAFFEHKGIAVVRHPKATDKPLKFGLCGAFGAR